MTGCSTRHAKKQRFANRDDDQSKITYIDGGTNIVDGSHGTMMISPGFDGGCDNNMSSKGTMEAVLAPEDASTSPSHDPPGQSTTNITVRPSSDKECQLGASFLMLVSECIAHMVLNTTTEDALLELYMTLSRAVVYIFDETVAFIEQHVGTTFQKGDTLPRQATLIKQMADKHSVPPT